MVNLKKVAKILNIELKHVEEYTKVWGELYDLNSTSDLEYAEMIHDIVLCYE